MNVACNWCGKSIKRKLFLVKRNKRNFCSVECKAQWQKKYLHGSKHPSWRGGGIRCMCKQCSKIFFIKRSAIKRGCGIFCSKSCASKWHFTGKKTGKENPNWKGGKETKICKQCGGKFLIYASALKRKRTGTFCCARCKGIWVASHSKKKDTYIEMKIEKELIRQNITYRKQIPVESLRVVDFLLPHNRIIECDGTYWHSLAKAKKRDADKDFLLLFHGYKILRLSEYDINNHWRKCQYAIKKFWQGGIKCPK